jgi:hypothetical protein
LVAQFRHRFEIGLGGFGHMYIATRYYR